MAQNATIPPSPEKLQGAAFYKHQADHYRNERDKLLAQFNAKHPKDGHSDSLPRGPPPNDQIADLLNLAEKSIRRWRKSVDLVNILMNKTGNQDHDSPADDVATLQTQLAAAKQQIANSYDEMRIAEDDCAKVKERLRTEIGKLHKKLEAEKASHGSSIDKVATLQTQLAAAKQQNVNLDDEIKRVKDECAETKSRLRKDIEELQKKFETAKRDHNPITDGVADLEIQLARANRQITNSNDEANKVKDDCTKAKAKFQKDIKKLQKELEAAKASNAKTLQQRDDLRTQINELLKTIGIPIDGETALIVAKLVQTSIPDQASEATLRSIAQQLQTHLRPIIDSLDLSPIPRIPFRLVKSPLNSTLGLDENDSTVYNRQVAAVFAAQLQANISRIVNRYNSKDFRKFFGNVLLNAGLINHPPRIPPAPKRSRPHSQGPNRHRHDNDSDSDNNGGGGGRTLKLVSNDDPLPTTEDSNQSNDSDRNGPFTPNIDTPKSDSPDGRTTDVGDESETEVDDHESPSIRPASRKARRLAKLRARIPPPIITPRRGFLPRSRQRATPAPSSSRPPRTPYTPRTDPAILARRKWISENWKAFPGISPKKDTTSVSAERPLRPGMRQKIADDEAATAERKLERAKRLRATARRDERRAVAGAKGEGRSGRLRAETARGRSQRAGEAVRHARGEARRLKRRADRLRGRNDGNYSSSSSSSSASSSSPSDDEDNDEDKDPRRTSTPSKNLRTPRSKTISKARFFKSQSTTVKADSPSTRRSARTARLAVKVATRAAPGPRERQVGRKRDAVGENEDTPSRGKKRKMR